MILSPTWLIYQRPLYTVLHETMVNGLPIVFVLSGPVSPKCYVLWQASSSMPLSLSERENTTFATLCPYLSVPVPHYGSSRVLYRLINAHQLADTPSFHLHPTHHINGSRVDTRQPRQAPEGQLGQIRRFLGRESCVSRQLPLLSSGLSRRSRRCKTACIVSERFMF